MKSRLSTLVATALFLTTLGTGCETGTVKEPSPTSAPAPQENTTPEGQTAFAYKRSGQAPPEAVPMTQAWPDAQVVSFEMFLPDNRAWLPLAISEDGMIAGSVPRQKAVPKPAELILFDPNTKQYETIATLDSTSQPVGVDINENWIVWSEVLDNSYTNWNMHVYDRKTRKDQVVARSGKDAQGNGYHGPIWMPHLYQDEFVWSPATAQPTDKGPSIVVQKYNIKTGKTDTLVERGGNPILTENFLAWNGPDENQNAAVFWNRGGESRQVTQGKSVSFFTTDGDSIAWSGLQRQSGSQKTDRSDDYWELAVIDPTGNERLIKKGPPEDALQFLTMSERILAWTAYKKVQVYDRKLDKIVTLSEKDAEYAQVYTNGDYLYWTLPIPQTEEERQQARQNGVYPHRMHLIKFH
jgi:hypothetical protein